MRTLFDVGERMYEGVREAMCEMSHWLREGGELEAPWGTLRVAVCSCEQPGAGERREQLCVKEIVREAASTRGRLQACGL